MKHFCSRIWLLLMAATALGTDHSSSASGRSAAAQQSAVRILWATSGRCVGLERQAASQEAEEKARQQLLEKVGRLAEERTGRKLSPQRLFEEQAWLLSQPGVDRKGELTVDEKPYGLVAEQTICVTLPEAVLARWAERLAWQRRGYTRRIVYSVAGTLIGWLVGLVLLVRLDRATGGYYRRVLVPVVLVVLLVATVLGWVWFVSSG